MAHPHPTLTTPSPSRRNIFSRIQLSSMTCMKYTTLTSSSHPHPYQTMYLIFTQKPSSIFFLLQVGKTERTKSKHFVSMTLLILRVNTKERTNKKERNGRKIAAATFTFYMSSHITLSLECVGDFIVARKMLFTFILSAFYHSRDC